MADDRTAARMTEADVANRTFDTVRRGGYDQKAVDEFVRSVAAEVARLGAELAVVEQRAEALARLDEAAVAEALGEEATRVVQAARESAAAIEVRAEERAAELLKETQAEAVRVRDGMEAERAQVHAQAIADAEEAVADAERRRAGVEAEVEAARQAGLDDAVREGQALLAEAKAAREKVLVDLSRRRKTARKQLEQLVAARDRLLTAFAVVRTAVDDATHELRNSLGEARTAADAAVRRVDAEPTPSVEALEHEIEALRMAGLPLTSEDEPEAEDAAPAPAPPAGEEHHEAPPSYQVRRDLVREEALHQVEVAAPFEEVRVLPPDPPVIEPEPKPLPEPEPLPEPAAEVHAPAREVAAESEEVAEPEAAAAEPEPPAAEPEPEPEPEVEDPERPAVDEVDALFARLRAGRTAEVTAARQVIDDAQVLGERDESLAGVVTTLSRGLKRVLADEQNEVLDALRRTDGRDPAAVVPDPDEHSARWAAAAEPALVAAAAAGAQGDVDVAQEAAAATAAALAADVARPLGERVTNAVFEADGDVDAAADGIRAAYRHWRGRLGDLADQHVAAAFTLGVYVAAPPDALLRWVVDDGKPCADCDDNALAGGLPKGEPFPTGQLVPPAHPGCRCTLAVAASGRDSA